MTNCYAELCRNWTGQGCACEVFGLQPVATQPRTPMVFRVSRELIRLAIDNAASKAAKDYVEGAFAVQFNGARLDLGDTNISFATIDMDNFNLDVKGVEIEWVD